MKSLTGILYFVGVFVAGFDRAVDKDVGLLTEVEFSDGNNCFHDAKVGRLRFVKQRRLPIDLRVATPKPSHLVVLGEIVVHL